MSFFFFFQAEDGIRDPLVTGVQTCALPIWWRSASFEEPSERQRPVRVRLSPVLTLRQVQMCFQARGGHALTAIRPITSSGLTSMKGDPITAPLPGEASASSVRLGLRANWQQFTLLVIVNAFVGGMIGLERAVVPLIAERDFGLVSRTGVLSFIV